MKISNTVFFVFITFSFTCLSQKNNDLLLITKQKKISEIINQEKEGNNNYEFLNRNIQLSEQVFPYLEKYEIEKPVIIKRKSETLPVYSQYFYSKNDSIVRYINYDWERAKFENYKVKQKIWKEENKKMKLYDSKYELIKLNLVRCLGIPNFQDTKPRLTKSQFGNKDYYLRETKWYNEQFVANLNLVFADNTYRIRYNIYWIPLSERHK